MSVRTGWAAVLLGALLACGGNGGENDPPTAGSGGDLQAPIQLRGDFQLTLWGDADRIQVNDQCADRGRPGDTDGHCICVTATRGPSAWGAVFWETRRETGVRRPVTLRGATKVTFWARGERGGEKVHFHLGGVAASELLQPGEPAELSDSWQRFELELKDRKLEQITGLFGVRWRCAGGQNPEGVKLYLDDIRYE